MIGENKEINDSLWNSSPLVILRSIVTKDLVLNF